MTELAQDGEFRVAVALPLATTPPLARDRDGAADDGVEPRHVREGYRLTSGRGATNLRPLGSCQAEYGADRAS